ncbi:MAG: hypothetical protein OXE80_01485 [Gammaproteobacteria bacterium]|nr:hypothetical protein [Gammaproteobacteria bacterium]MCY4297568.1 hypothetical protein [Gammaproteobacteria bacterium]
MHDAVSAERAGTPALAVMTERFVSAAELMARVLGMPGYEFAVIEHPVSSASDTELAQRAQAVIECLARMLPAAVAEPGAK